MRAGLGFLEEDGDLGNEIKEDWGNGVVTVEEEGGGEDGEEEEGEEKPAGLEEEEDGLA